MIHVTAPSSTPPPETLIVFDLGRVLVRICDGWSEAFHHAGLGHLCAEVEGRLRDKPRRAALSQLVFALEKGEITPAQFSDESARLLERGSDEVARTLDAYLRRPYPGAVALLDDLVARGHATACLSNTNARHWEIMQGWDDPADQIWPRLGLRCASHELAVRKPDAAIYAKLEALACIDGDASHVVFFDDLADNVAAARTRGWRAVEVRSREDPVTEMRAVLEGFGLL